MKSYIQLANIANTYYDIWTSDGIDAFHADADNIAAWLKREDLRTDADTALDDLTDDEIEKIASMIADMVDEKMKEAHPVDTAWYAVEIDEDDNDWGTGSFDYTEAVAMARRMDAKYIAVIRLGDDPICERVIDLTEEDE